MSIDSNIKQKADDIRTKVYGSEVRESLASGLEAMSEDVVSNTDRQTDVESQFQDVIENTTDKDVISAPEIIAARNGEANLKTRIDKEKQEVTAQLAEKAGQDDLNVEKARIDTLSTLPDGSTTNDARLEDIIVGDDGITYNSPGNAVRGQLSKKANKTDLEQTDNKIERVSSFQTIGEQLNVPSKTGYFNISTSLFEVYGGYESIEYVLNGESYLYVTASILGTNAAMAVYLDANDSVISYVNRGTTTLVSYEQAELTIPENCYKVIVTSRLSTPLLYGDKTKIVQSVLDNKEKIVELNNKIITGGWLTPHLLGKTHLIVGDSIGLETQSYDPWPVFISNRFGTNRINKSFGQTGFLCAKPGIEAGTGSSLLGRIQIENSFANLDYDFLTIQMGRNDFAVTDASGTTGVALGSLETLEDDRTFYGAVKFCLNYFLTTYPTKGLGVLTPLPTAVGFEAINQKGHTFEEYVQAIIEVCELMNVSCLDATHNNRLRPWLTPNVNLFYEDPVHPNSAGHEYVSKFVENWLITL